MECWWGASKPLVQCGGVGSGCARDASASVAVEGEAVDHDGVAEEVERLAVVAEAVCAAEPEGVVEVAVDGFGVVAAGVEAREVGSPCGIGRTFSVRFSFRAVSCSVLWSRMVTIPAPW
jgi:tagatose-1,6-bisphosphate aldolase non-catalytic subunit AgaZ/GatZ